MVPCFVIQLLKLFTGNSKTLDYMKLFFTSLLTHFEMHTRDNICHIVKAPADVPWKINKLATDVAQKAVGSLEGAGVFAVELFLTEDGQVFSHTFLASLLPLFL